MKTVGIILREFKSKFGELPLYGLAKGLINFLRKYDINIICIPVKFDNNNEFKKIQNILDFCDGIIFPGGSGINQLDCDIVKYLYEIDKPTFGICLGMQILGKTFNGNVLSNGADKLHNNLDEYAHKVSISKNSKLYEILGASEIQVNSSHFDCVEYTDLDCVAYDDMGLIEAIEDKNKHFFIGVQWHPETNYDDIYSNKLFDSFIESL